MAETDEVTVQTTENTKVAVITGASSGIGRATALKFADEGYNLVLAARRQGELEEVARQAIGKGVEALPVSLDTSEEPAVQELCQRAVETFGHIDVWVNDAAVYMAGKLQDLPAADMKRLMDVNFFGYVFGSQAALKQFRGQGYGTLINISSVNAAAPQPYTSIYGASKAAVRAFDEAVRMELKLDGLAGKIHVCTIMPASVDTNLFQNSANYTGHELQALEPVYDPAYVAEYIFKMTEKPRRSKFVGPAGTLMALQNAHIRPLYEKQVGAFTQSDIIGEDAAEPTQGNLYGPLPENRGTHGGWRERQLPVESLNRMVGLSAAAVAGIISAGILLAKKRRA